jgi:prepilin-type N-terminal cleavage/methylation domain-containing protein
MLKSYKSQQDVTIMLKQKGFSLVELSISIVIISIIAGGIMSSTNIIGATKLKIIIKEAREYQTAFDSFKEKFKYYPGDFPNGAKYWGTDCNGATGGTDLCSGDGNFKIKDGANDALTGTSETFLAWKHFEKAGLVPNSFTGLKGAGSNCSGSDTCATVGANVPMSQWGTNVGYYLISGTNEVGLFLGGQDSNTWNDVSSLKPEDAQSIDAKIDDGDPINGYFRASFITGVTLTNAASCLTGATTYTLTTTTTACGAVFILDGQK